MRLTASRCWGEAFSGVELVIPYAISQDSLFFCQVSYFTAHTKDLSDIGEVHVVIDFLAGPDAPDFDPSMILIERLVLRGGNRPG